MKKNVCRPFRRLNSRLLLAIVLAFQCPPAPSAANEHFFGGEIRRNARGALAILGIAAVPNETASVLFLDTGTNADSGFDFQSGQFGGGFRLSENVPLYLEGYFGFTRYDPVFVLTQGASKSLIPAKWTGGAATGGVGWEFVLGENWKFRPIVNFSLGRIQSDSSVAAQIISDELGIEVDFLKGGGLSAYGYGGSLALVYNKKWQDSHELDIRIRHTQLHLKPFDSEEIITGANAISTVVWSRYRVPSGAKVFGRPMRYVGEFAASYLSGDQRDILNTDWLVQTGAGIEFDVTKTALPVLTQARLMARATIGENLQGFSIGISLSF